jgi:formate hydrogenlyase subunit 4
MLELLGAVVAQILHLALVLAAAPLVVGTTRWLKARMMGRRGAPPLQPFRDLGKLLRKRPVLA